MTEIKDELKKMKEMENLEKRWNTGPRTKDRKNICDELVKHKDDMSSMRLAGSCSSAAKLEVNDWSQKEVTGSADYLAIGQLKHLKCILPTETKEVD